MNTPVEIIWCKKFSAKRRKEKVKYYPASRKVISSEFACMSEQFTGRGKYECSYLNVGN